MISSFLIKLHCSVEMLCLVLHTSGHSWDTKHGRTMQLLSQHFISFIAWINPTKGSSNITDFSVDFSAWSYHSLKQLYLQPLNFQYYHQQLRKVHWLRTNYWFTSWERAMGSPEKAGQCCHFQSDWHWAVSLHSTVRDSALVANTGSSVTAAVQSKIVWKHEWMVDLVHKKMWC